MMKKYQLFIVKIMRILIAIFVLMIPFMSCGQRTIDNLIEPELIKADIDTLISKLNDTHPTFWKYYQDNRIQNKVDSIKKTINSPISTLEFYRIIQPLINIDGHTSLIYRDGVNPSYQNPLLPFKIVIYNNVIYVKENFTENKTISKGMIIEKINGISSHVLIQNLIRYIPGEKEFYKLKKLELDFNYYYQLIYGSFQEFEITINNKKMNLKGANWSDFEEPRKPPFELHFYDNDIAYLCKRTFFSKEFSSYMESAFRKISEKQIKYLIIDNHIGGGLTDLADTLTTYLTDKPFSSFERKEKKISSLTKEIVEIKKERGYFKDGYLIQNFEPESINRNYRFKGKTYILTGPLTYSTATCFSATAKCYKAALIVGEESGQPLLSNGGMAQFVLPNTNLTCITSLERIYMSCHNYDSISGVQPDYYVEPSLDDLLNDSNYTLKYTLNLIREQKNE